jgi:hypothetical protein
MDLVRFCDLDGTLIHSHRAHLEKGVLVEMYHGKPLSYMNDWAYERLQNIPKDLFVPVTSRTKEQYKRISLYRDGGTPKYALLDNGGVLLVDGEEDLQWKLEIQQYISLERWKYYEIMTHVCEYGETKLQDDLVIFVKPFSEEKRKLLVGTLHKFEGMQVFQHGSKVYICSDKLTKGYALKRFLDKYAICAAVAAGDSEVDLTMIDYVSYGFYSSELEKNVKEPYLSKISFVDKLNLAECILNFEW